MGQTSMLSRGVTSGVMSKKLQTVAQALNSFLTRPLQSTFFSIDVEQIEDMSRKVPCEITSGCFERHSES
jgi:hypothetical protein